MPGKKKVHNHFQSLVFVPGCTTYELHNSSVSIGFVYAQAKKNTNIGQLLRYFVLHMLW